VNRCWGVIAGGLAALILSKVAVATEPMTCSTVLATQAFVALDIVTEDNTRDLDREFASLLGTTCTFEELETYFVKKGATLERKTNTNLYLLVTTATKLLRTGSVRFPTSIIVSFDNGVVDFVGASVAK
jgi:hypothetical protein